jgi:hypothetical protein
LLLLLTSEQSTRCIRRTASHVSYSLCRLARGVSHTLGRLADSVASSVNSLPDSIASSIDSLANGSSDRAQEPALPLLLVAPG